MSVERFVLVSGAASQTLDACWNRIGVRGDCSCPDLEQHVHCRNCPVYSQAARHLLDHEAPPGYATDWTRHYAHPKAVDELDLQAIMIFRVGAEWLALAAAVVMEVTDLRPIHSLPHRRGGVVLGLANIRGELLPCVSLSRILALDESTEQNRASADQRFDQRQKQRLLVIRRVNARIVCPVDHVHGIHRIKSQDCHDLPATVAKSSSTYSKVIVPWNDHSVGLLDDEQLFSALRRSLA